jgi:hypothetical protein
MVNMSPAELQNQGVDEKTIQLLETNRVALQRLLQEQRAFAESVRNNAQNASHGEQNGAMGHRPPSMGPSPPFGAGSSQQSQHNLLSIAGRPQQHHLIQQSIPNGVDALMGSRMPGQQMPSSLASQGPVGGNSMQSFAQKASMNQAAQLVERFRNEYALSSELLTWAVIFLS